MWVVESVYNLLPFFDRHRSIKTNILVPRKRKKNSYCLKIICNYSLEYLFLFIVCTLFVLIIDVYNKQTNKQKTTTKKAKTTVIWLCFVSTKLRFVTFVFSNFLLSLFFSPVFQYSVIWFWTLLRIKRIKRVERWWEVRKDCSTIWEIDRKTAVIWKIEKGY